MKGSFELFVNHTLLLHMLVYDTCVVVQSPPSPYSMQTFKFVQDVIIKNGCLFRSMAKHNTNLFPAS
jgi:hypothetical protein